MFDLMVVSDLVRERVREKVSVDRDTRRRNRWLRSHARRARAVPAIRTARRRERLQEPCAEPSR